MSSETGTSSALSDATSLFNGQRLAMARQLAGLKKSHLAELVGMSPASVTGWESGAKLPNRVTVAKLALALQVDPRFFAGGAPPRISKPHFRSLRSTTQTAQDEAEAYGRFAAEVIGLLDASVEFPDLLLPDLPVDIDDHLEDASDAARTAREFFGIPPGPVQHVIRLAERAGVAVVFSEPAVASIDAYSLHSSTRPVIVLNPTKNDYYRQRFDVAHELGHLIMHHDAEPGSKIAEDQAHHFAAELLMPADQIGSHLPTNTSGRAWTRLAELKEHWGVSLTSLLYRARSLGVMSDVSHRNAMIRLSQNGWRRSEPGRVSTLEMPSMLARAREALAEVGVDDLMFLSGAGLSQDLYRVVTSRAPQAQSPRKPEPSDEGLPGGVVSPRNSHPPEFGRPQATT